MWISAAKVVLIGMGTVFLALIVLALALHAMSRFARKAMQGGSATSESGGEMGNSSASGVELDSGGTPSVDASPSSDVSSAVVSDDAAMVAAIAAACYQSSRRRAAERERRLSPWSLEGRRMLLFNRPIREPWRKTF